MRLIAPVSMWLLLLATPLAFAACPPWPAHHHQSLQALAICSEPPVERQVGNLCVRHEWLCGRTTFQTWFEQWMSEADEPFALEKRLGQLIFSGQQHDTAWAVFWAPANESSKGFVILVSRMRAAPSTERF